MRSAHWANAIPHIQEWVEDRFRSHDRSLWDYIDRKVSFKEVGINSTNFFKELAPLIPETKRDHWSDDEWWSHVSGRIYYFFHKPRDRADRANGKPRPRRWAEWTGPIPPRPEEAVEPVAVAPVQEADGHPTTALVVWEKWDQWRSLIMRVAGRFHLSA